MNQDTFISDLTRAIDAKDAGGLVNYMTGDAQFRFANMPPVIGNENIKIFLTNFFQSIQALSHSDVEYWQTADVWFMNGYVAYTRLNGTQLKVPFANLLKMNGDKIKDYLIFVDNSELYK
jgi:hypothetical protein